MERIVIIGPHCSLFRIVSTTVMSYRSHTVTFRLSLALHFCLFCILSCFVTNVIRSSQAGGGGSGHYCRVIVIAICNSDDILLQLEYSSCVVDVIKSAKHLGAREIESVWILVSFSKSFHVYTQSPRSWNVYEILTFNNNDNNNNNQLKIFKIFYGHKACSIRTPDDQLVTILTRCELNRSKCVCVRLSAR